jgi:hypothetical protein
MQFSPGSHTHGGAGVNRRLYRGRIAQKANASGKARGYADVKTVTESVKLQVANEATHG